MFFFQAEDGIRDLVRSRGLGDVYKRQDWFVGDDMHHNGAFSVLMSFNFFKGFGKPRPEPLTKYPPAAEYDSPDAYNFFLDHTPLKKLNEKILKNEIPFWDSIMAHGNYDYFWKSRSNLQHLKNMKPAILLVGGWYDAEAVSYTHLRAHETVLDLVCRLLLEKKKKEQK